MKKLKLKLEVEVTSIEVEDGYFTIEYKYRKDGGKWKKDSYNSDYESWTESEWRKELEKGEALHLAFQQISEC